MELKPLSQSFSICKLKELSPADLEGEFCFLGKTDEELSLVCPTDRAPEHTAAREDGWKAFRIQGILDFSLTGVLAGIASLLAAQGIGIFAVSTFQTDYILTKSEQFQKALEALAAAGYRIVS